VKGSKLLCLFYTIPWEKPITSNLFKIKDKDNDAENGKEWISKNKKVGISS